MAKFINLSGVEFGRLKADTVNSIGNGMTKWNCVCNCGNKCIVSVGHLRSGHTKSCGCYNSQSLSERATHGFTVRNKRLYGIWTHMKTRCYNKNSDRYKYYGAKGISICDEWLNDNSMFFKWAVENGYSNNLTIERDDVFKDYEPSNCKWIPMAEQSKNRSNVISEFQKNEIRILLSNGGITVKEMSERYNVHRTTISKIKKSNLPNFSVN